MYAKHRTCRPNVCRTSKGKTAGANHLAIQKQQADNELFQAHEGHQPLQTRNFGRLLSYAPGLFQTGQFICNKQRQWKQQLHWQRLSQQQSPYRE